MFKFYFSCSGNLSYCIYIFTIVLKILRLSSNKNKCIGANDEYKEN